MSHENASTDVSYAKSQAYFTVTSHVTKLGL